MTKAIPEHLRRTVWTLYLDGKSLGTISMLTGVAKSSVFNIVRSIEKEDPDYPLMRALVVDLKKNGSDLKKYAAIIRRLLDEYGIDYPTGEALLSEFLPVCYKLQWQPSEALKALQDFSNSAEEYGHSLKEHAEYFNKLYAMVQRMQLSLKVEGKKLHDLIQKYDIVRDNLDVFLSEDGVTQWVVNNEMTTVESEHEIKELKKELSLSQLGKSIDPQELNKLNDSLITPVSESEVVAKLEDIRRHLSMYSNLFEKPLPEDSEKMARSLKLPPTANTSDDPPHHNIPETSVNQN